MHTFVWYGIIALFALFALVALIGVGASAPTFQPMEEEWWKRHDWQRFTEGFTSEGVKEEKKESFEESVVLTFPPGKPAPVNKDSHTPFHLLEDVMAPPRDKEALSCVTSRSCYATDFDAQQSKLGNYRQWTNQYKRGTPDNCSAPRQELVLNFYKAETI